MVSAPREQCGHRLTEVRPQRDPSELRLGAIGYLQRQLRNRAMRRGNELIRFDEPALPAQHVAQCRLSARHEQTQAVRLGYLE